MADRSIDVSKLTVAYRRLVVWFGAQLLVNCGSFGFRAFQEQSILVALVQLAFAAAILVTVVALALYGFRTAQALGSPVAWLWAIAIFIPCINVLSLLALSSKATQACAARGIPVGFLGPKPVVNEPPSAPTGNAG